MGYFTCGRCCCSCCARYIQFIVIQCWMNASLISIIFRCCLCFKYLSITTGLLTLCHHTRSANSALRTCQRRRAAHARICSLGGVGDLYDMVCNKFLVCVQICLPSCSSPLPRFFHLVIHVEPELRTFDACVPWFMQQRLLAEGQTACLPAWWDVCPLLYQHLPN